MTLQELRAQLASNVKAAGELLAAAEADGGRDLTEAEAKSFADLEAKVNADKAAIAKAEEHDERRQKAKAWSEDLKKSNRRVPPVLDNDRQQAARAELAPLALQAWLRQQSRRTWELTAEQEEACKAVGINPHSKELELRWGDDGAFAAAQREFRNGHGEPLNRAMAAYQSVSHLSTTTLASGGAILPPGQFMQSLEANLLAFGGVLQVSDVLTTDNRGPITWPTMDDTANKAVRVGEAGATTQQNMTFGQKVWNLYKYTSACALPYELLDGSAFNLVPMLGGMFGERLGRKWADDFTTGTGAAQPYGIVTNASSTSAAGSSAIAWADLETLITSVDPAYRTGAVFMFHDAIRSALMNLKDGDGLPMWQMSPNSSAPTMLKGYPWFINQSMDSTVSSGKKTILFGRLSTHKVRRYATMRLYRLDQLYKESDMDNFVVFAEADSNTLSAGTAPFKVLTH